MNLSEAGSFMLLVIFNKCMDELDFSHPLLPKPQFETDHTQLMFMNQIYFIIKERIKKFQETLFIRGSKQDLFHGFLGFFRALFGNETIWIQPCMYL